MTAKPNVPVPPEAAEVQRTITGRLRTLLARAHDGADMTAIARGYRAVLRLYDEYQGRVIAASGLSMMCHAGCVSCCCHWVDDVYSFEAAMIAAAVRRMSHRRRESVIAACRESIEEYERVRAASAVRLESGEYQEIAGEVDFEEIVLTGFYQLHSRCPFLDEDDRCIIYDLRPLTCRAYINLGDPAACPPENILDEEESTYILDLDGESNRLLDDLSARVARHPGDTGLRSLVLKCLEDR